MNLNRQQLTGLLRAYGEDEYGIQPAQPTMKIIGKPPNQVSATVEQVCWQAADMIEKDAIHALKFESMVTIMKKLGMEDMYKYLMGQDISEALLK